MAPAVRRNLDRQALRIEALDRVNQRQALDRIKIVSAHAIDQRKLPSSLREPDAMGIGHRNHSGQSRHQSHTHPELTDMLMH
jgi:hypothetical protein